MGLINSNKAVVATVQRHIGTAYDTILLVSHHVDAIAAVVDYIDEINVVGPNIANVNLVAGSIADVNLVADNMALLTTVNSDMANITTVAGISGDVTAVSVIAPRVLLVADNVADIVTVTSNMADVNTVAGISSDVTQVVSIDSDVSTVATNIANVIAVGADIDAVVTLAGLSSEIAVLDGISGDIATVAADKAAFDISYANFTSEVGVVNSAMSTFTTITAPGFVQDASDEADRAETEADRADAAAATISAIGAYAGEWVNLTGAITIPASVGHAGSIWLLNGNLADVTLSEPSGPNTDWNLYTSGANAYEIAVANGFVGTEQLWLDTITGAYEEYGVGDSADDNTLNGYAKYEASHLEAVTDGYPDLGFSDATNVIYAIHTWGSATLPGKKVQECTGSSRWFKRFRNGNGDWQAWKEVSFDYVAPDLTPNGLGVLALDSSNTLEGPLNLKQGLVDNDGDGKVSFSTFKSNIQSSQVDDGEWYVLARFTYPVFPSTWDGDTLYLTRSTNANIPRSHDTTPATVHRYAIALQSSDNVGQQNDVEVYGTETANIRVHTVSDGVFEIQWKAAINAGLKLELEYGAGVHYAQQATVEYFELHDDEDATTTGTITVPTLGLHIEEHFGELDSTKLTYLGDKVDRSSSVTRGTGDDSTIEEVGTTIYYTATRAESEADGYPPLGTSPTIVAKWLLKTEGIEGVYRVQTATTGGWSYTRADGAGGTAYGVWVLNSKDSNIEIVTASKTMHPWGVLYVVDTDSLELTFPVLPEPGQKVPMMIGNIENITLLRNGENINGVADDLLWDIPNSSPVFTYINATIGWRA